MWETIAALMPAIISGAGAVFGNNQKTTTDTSGTQLSPEMQELVKEMMGRGSKVFLRPYTKYEGQRVAGPSFAADMAKEWAPKTQSMMDQVMANPYKDAVDRVISRPATSVSVPNLV